MCEGGHVFPEAGASGLRINQLNCDKIYYLSPEAPASGFMFNELQIE